MARRSRWTTVFAATGAAAKYPSTKSERTKSLSTGRLTLGCSRRDPLRSCLPDCDIIASRTARLNPWSLAALRPSLHIPWLAVAAVVFACSGEPRSSQPPSGAQITQDGVRWLRLKDGAGRLGSQAEWWSVSWTDVPCEGECKHVYNGRRNIKIYDPFRTNLLAMREGEVRRLWVPHTGGKRFWTADVELYQVYMTGPDGGPLVPPNPRHGSRFNRTNGSNKTRPPTDAGRVSGLTSRGG